MENVVDGGFMRSRAGQALREACLIIVTKGWGPSGPLGRARNFCTSLPTMMLGLYTDLDRSSLSAMRAEMQREVEKFIKFEDGERG